MHPTDNDVGHLALDVYAEVAAKGEGGEKRCAKRAYKPGSGRYSIRSKTFKQSFRKEYSGNSNLNQFQFQFQLTEITLAGERQQ